MTDLYTEQIIENNKLITLHDVMSMVSVSRSTVKRMVDAGTFPASVKVGSRTLWRLAEVVKYVESL